MGSMIASYRVALSFDPIERPAPDEPRVGVWIYEIHDAASPEIAEGEAVQRWQKDNHFSPGGGVAPTEVVLTLI
jgi:hypothetical protein